MYFNDLENKEEDGWFLRQCLYSHLTHILIRRNISSRFSSNSESNASELLEDLEEMFSYYW